MPSFSYSALKQVEEAVENNAQKRVFFNVYGIISHYKFERGRRQLTIRDEETSDLHITLNWKNEVIWNPNSKPFKRDDFELGDIIRIHSLCVERGGCSVQDVKQLLVFRGFHKEAAAEYFTQGVAYVHMEPFDRQRSQQLDKFMCSEMISCRFSDLPAESGVRSFCGRVTFYGITTEGHQILYLTDGTRPGIGSHSETKQNYMYQEGSPELDEMTIKVRVTDPVPSAPAVHRNEVMIALNAKFDHQDESELTLITTNRNKKLGKAVRIIDPDSLVAKSLNLIVDHIPKSGDEAAGASQQEPVASASSSSSSASKRKTCGQKEESGDSKSIRLEIRSSTSSSPSSSQMIGEERETLLSHESPAERLFPSFVDTPIPLSVTCVSRLIALPYERPSYAIEATAVDCNFKHNDICDLVHVRCPVCEYTESLSDRLDGKVGEFLGEANKSKNLKVLPCPDRSHANDDDGNNSENVPSLGFVFSLFFVIRDKPEKKDMVVSLSTLSAIKLFGVTPMDALRFQEKRAKVFQILEAICPENPSDRPDNFLLWLIKAFPVGSANTRFVVLTVTKGCSATKGPATK